MLFKIPGGFSSIPGEHNLCIYSNYNEYVKGKTMSVFDPFELPVALDHQCIYFYRSAKKPNSWRD